MRTRTIVLALLVSASIGETVGQGLRQRDIPQTQRDMHARVFAVYDFHPSKVSDADRQAKSKQMDDFWNVLKATPQTTLPLLRGELRDSSNPAFFFFDGSELLLSLSKSREDEELVATALPRVDLADVHSRSYFYTTHDLACDGVDVTAAALHTLDRSDFSVIVPEHAMTLDRRTALMYLLLSMKEDLWVKPAEERFTREVDHEAKLALVDVFSYAQTDEADAELVRIAADGSQPQEVRDEAKRLLEEARKTASSWFPVMGTVAGIREQRRQRLRAVSDEAMDDVQEMTRKIVELRAKGKK